MMYIIDLHMLEGFSNDWVIKPQIKYEFFNHILEALTWKHLQGESLLGQRWW